MKILLMCFLYLFNPQKDIIYHREGRARSFGGTVLYETDIILTGNGSFHHNSIVYKLYKRQKKIISSDSFKGEWTIKGDSLLLYYYGGDSTDISNQPVGYLMKRKKIIRRAIDGKKIIFRVS